MKEALIEYATGMKPALYIANKYGVDVMELHTAYAKLANSGKA